MTRIFRYNGKILRVDGKIAKNDDCCCDNVCVCDCLDLQGYTGDLCVQITGSNTASSRLMFTQEPGLCSKWANPGSVPEFEGCVDIGALDIELRCENDQPPKLVLSLPDQGDECDIVANQKGVELTADNLNCAVGMFLGVWTVTIDGADCVCNPMTMTFTITKCPP